MLISLVIYFPLFISGLLFGSFLNLVSDRVLTKKGIVFGRSVCDSCGKTLSPKELIPVISYVLQRGKCGSCKSKLSIIYPLSELMTGGLFVSIAFWLQLADKLTFSNWLLYFYYLIVTCFLVILFLTDLKEMVVPVEVVVPGILFVILSQVLALGAYLYTMYQQLLAWELGKYLIEAGFFKEQIIRNVTGLGVNYLAALGVSAFFLGLIFITKGRGMGGGDVTLGFLVGAIVGFPNVIVALFVSFLTGAVYSVILVIANRKGLKDAIAFGPFLIFGCFIALFFGSRIFEWYIHLL